MHLATNLEGKLTAETLVAVLLVRLVFMDIMSVRQIMALNYLSIG